MNIREAFTRRTEACEESQKKIKIINFNKTQKVLIILNSSSYHM